MDDSFVPLWKPSNTRVTQTALTRFMETCEIKTVEELKAFSLSQMGNFWNQVWEFGEVIGEKGTVYLENPTCVQEARFFPHARLSYAENLLRRQDQTQAITFFNERGDERTLTAKALYQRVSQLQQMLKSFGVRVNDCVAGYLPNLPETVMGLLASNSLGAVWSSCAPDFGVQSVIDRFSQISPKVLITVDGYFYGGKTFDCLERLPAILAAVPSIEQVIVVGYADPARRHIFLDFDKSLALYKPTTITFEHLPFDHPLAILYSSGTTGVPKCIVHGNGGTLLQHIKEHQLHSDIQKGDRVFYYTTCGWMMWNWLVSALASEAHIFLYDGAPLYPNDGHLFELIEKHDLTFFGTSAKYLMTLQKNGFCPTQKLTSLKTIASTGSILPPETFAYIYEAIKSDVHLESISGGTDIVACFMLGNPNEPVWAGQLQTAGFGLAVDVFDAAGSPCSVGVPGELVCTQPFPSRPIGFWNDPTHEKYTNAYFKRYPNVWHHGDFVEKTPEGGFIVQGRSDAVLNPGGVRIGTGEIYQQVETFPEVKECLAVGYRHDQDEQIVLFVVLQPGYDMRPEWIQSVKKRIRQNTTPRHVPWLIVAAPDLPKTRNGKLAEIAVRDLIHNRPVLNKDVFVNPECLSFFQEFRVVKYKTP